MCCSAYGKFAKEANTLHILVKITHGCERNSAKDMQEVTAVCATFDLSYISCVLLILQWLTSFAASQVCMVVWATKTSHNASQKKREPSYPLISRRRREAATLFCNHTVYGTGSSCRPFFKDFVVLLSDSGNNSVHVTATSQLAWFPWPPLPAHKRTSKALKATTTRVWAWAEVWWAIKYYGMCQHSQDCKHASTKTMQKSAILCPHHVSVENKRTTKNPFVTALHTINSQL